MIKIVEMSYENAISSLKAMRIDEMRRFAAACGIPFPTLARLRYGTTENPKRGTLEKLYAGLKSSEKVNEKTV